MQARKMQQKTWYVFIKILCHKWQLIQKNIKQCGLPLVINNFSNGLIIQWGWVEENTYVNYPITFNNVYAGVFTHMSGGITGTPLKTVIYLDTNKLYLRTDTGTNTHGYYIVIGN